MKVDEKGLAAGIEAAKESMADRDNHWEVALAVIQAYEAAKTAEGAVAWLIIYRNGRRSIVDAAKYDASSDAFWINAEAKAAAQITPLYAAPPPPQVPHE